ncbi:hypothetical protein C0431_08905 [bacterium]|nr:hypothetical protein [bacterium]
METIYNRWKGQLQRRCTFHVDERVVPMRLELPLSIATSVAKIEEILAGLPDQIESVELRLSMSLKTDDLMAKQALPFLVATLRQRSEHLLLKIFTTSLRVETLRDDPLLFAAASVSDQVILRGGTELESHVAHLIERAGEQRRKPKRRIDGVYHSTQSVRIIACDDLPQSILPSHFYRLDGSMISVTSFQDRIRTIWEPMNWAGSKETVEGISRILWELFENTDKHARVSNEYELVRHSIRGCMLDYQLADQISFLEQAHPVSQFLANSKQAGAAHFLFLTVFDSGVGIPEHRRPINESGVKKTDNELLAECFKMPVNGSSNRGRGLPLVADILGKMDIPGAAYIRSGSISAFLTSGTLTETCQKQTGRTGTMFTVILPYTSRGFKSKK